MHGFWSSCASPSHCCKKHIPAIIPTASCIGLKLKASHLDKQYQWGRTFPCFRPAGCPRAAASQGRWQTTRMGQLLLTRSGNRGRASGTCNWHKYPLTPPAHSGIFSKLWLGFLNRVLSAQRKENIWQKLHAMSWICSWRWAEDLELNYPVQMSTAGLAMPVFLGDK